MLKLRISRGNTLLDVIISLCIFTLMSVAAFDIYMAKVRLKNQNNQLSNYINCIEVAARNIYLNHSYDELLSYSGDDLWYINQQDLNVDNLSQGQILSLLSPNMKMIEHI